MKMKYLAAVSAFMMAISAKADIRLDLSAPGDWGTNYVAKAFTNQSGVVKLKQDLSITNKVTITGGGRAVAMSTKDLRLTIATGGELIVDNVVFSNATQTSKSLFLVNGGSLIFTNGTSLASCKNQVTGDAAKGSLVYLYSGSLCLAGTSFDNCTNWYPYAREVYVASTDAVLELGGAVRATVRYPSVDYAAAIKSSMKGGSVAISYGSTNVVDQIFATATGLTSSARSESVAAFTCSTESSVVAKVNTSGNFVWQAKPVEEQTPEGKLESETNAVVRVSGSSTTYWDSLEHALADLSEDNVTVTLLKPSVFTSEIVITNTMKLCASASANTLTRGTGARISVTGGELTIGNLEIIGRTSDTAVNHELILVDGASLVLDDGAYIHGVRGSGERSAGAVEVCNQGTFTMKSGAKICDCSNSFVQPSDGTGVGGAVMVDSGKAVFTGGEISGCSAYKAGGVFIGNEAMVEISGDVVISNNVTLAGADDNLYVADLENLSLTGKLTGWVGFTEGVIADTNVFGNVSSAYAASASDDELVLSARQFRHDTNGDYGFIAQNATNAADRILVWSMALDPTDGTYSDSGNEYIAVTSTAADPLVVDIPTLATNALEYTGESLSPTIIGASAGFIVGGDVSATEISTNTITFTSAYGWVWSDGTTGEKSSVWYIVAAQEPDPDPDPEPDPEPEEELAKVLPVAFTAIVEADGTWTLTAAPGVVKCRYYLVGSDDLKTWTTNSLYAPLVLSESDVDAVSNFTFSVESDAVKRFWKIEGADEN